MTPEETKSPYCPVCDGCGDEGCCKATICEMSPDGDYCQTYLKDLKFGYMMYNDIYELIPKDKETKELLDRIWEKNYKRAYK